MRRGSRRSVWYAAALVFALTGCGSAAKHETPASEAAAPLPPPPKPLPSPSKYVDDGQNGSLVPDNLDISVGADPLPIGSKRQLFGADVSWPQCPAGMGIPQKRSHGAPMPTAAATFVIIGLTNGPSFVRNPCLADQVAWVRERSLLAGAYAVLSYPDARTLDQLGGTGPFDKTDRLGRLRNVGYQAALFNVQSLREAGLRAPTVWLDVEPVPDFAWSTDTEANAAVVRGSVRGYADAGIALGVYSTPTMWREIVGDLRLGLPEWRPAGTAGQREALARCGADWSIQGGQALMAQWVEADRDRNVSCPGQAAALARTVGKP